MPDAPAPTVNPAAGPTARPLVSTVIATHDMGRFLPLAVQSVLAQTYPNVEAIVVDDGSTDDTQAAIEPFLDDARVRYVRQPQRGQAAAKNLGVAMARGPLVAFLDADDIWVADKLEAQLPLFDRPDTAVVYARLVHMDADGRDGSPTAYPLHRGRISGPLLISNFIAFGTAVVRRECFARMGAFRETLRMGIDYDLWLRFSTAFEFDFVDRPLLRYRIWTGQMSNNGTARMLTGIEIMKRFLAEHPGVVDARTEREAWAHTYVGLGDCVRHGPGGRRAALATYATALRHLPTYVPGWKALVRALLPGTPGGRAAG